MLAPLLASNKNHSNVKNKDLTPARCAIVSGAKKDYQGLEDECAGVEVGHESIRDPLRRSILAAITLTRFTHKISDRLKRFDFLRQPGRLSFASAFFLAVLQRVLRPLLTVCPSQIDQFIPRTIWISYLSSNAIINTLPFINHLTSLLSLFPWPFIVAGFPGATWPNPTTLSILTTACIAPLAVGYAKILVIKQRAVVKLSVKRIKQRPSPPPHCCTSFRERLCPPGAAHSVF